jgi:hypothetical protein
MNIEADRLAKEAAQGGDVNRFRDTLGELG